LQERDCGCEDRAVIVEALAWGPPVGDGANGAQFVTLRAVVKRNHDNAPYHVANEYVASRLAALVGLPVPAGGLLRAEDGDLAFISLYAGKDTETRPPVIVKELIEDLPYPAARIVAFDSWIGNLDRHRWNLAYDRAASVPLVIFDHDDCLALNKPNVAETLRARIRGILEQAVAYKLFTTEDAQAAFEFLLTRRQRLADLVKPITPNVKQLDLELDQ
jgi:hypothetical protein